MGGHRGASQGSSSPKTGALRELPALLPLPGPAEAYAACLRLTGFHPPQVGLRPTLRWFRAAPPALAADKRRC